MRRADERTVLIGIVLLLAGAPAAFEALADAGLQPIRLVSFVALALVFLGLCCVVLRQSLRAWLLSVLLVIAAGVATWALPLSRREQFADDVRRIGVGMTPEQVDEVMREHVKGATLPRPDRPYRDAGDLVSGVHLPGQTYYEAVGEDHSFDNFCLVTWGPDDRVVSVDLRED